jgi:hypothetical protein
MQLEISVVDYLVLLTSEYIETLRTTDAASTRDWSDIDAAPPEILELNCDVNANKLLGIEPSN